MLKFFRKIRQGLLEKGKLQQYVLYALGEILLVVIGILIALQVNNWNQQQSLKNIEQEYLKNLKNEFVSNLAELNSIYQIRQKYKEDLIKLMNLAGTNPKDTTDEALAKMLNSIYDYGRIVFLAKSPILEEIKNTGKLVTISNPALRKKLMLWEQKLEPIHGNQLEYKRLRDVFLSVMAKHGSIKDVGNTDPAFEKVSGLRFKNTNKNLLSNPEVGNFIYLIWGELEWFDKGIYPNAKNHAEEIIQLIEQDLK